MDKDIRVWCGQHGTTPDHSLVSNLHHLIAPVMGQIQLRTKAGDIQAGTGEYLYDRLRLALELADRELNRK